MSSAVHEARFADHMVQQTVTITENVRLAQDTYRLRFHAPEIARQIVPGQFLMLRFDACDDPLIGRPLALYDTVIDDSGAGRAIDVVYLVKGKFTTRLESASAGQKLQVWGPLGNGFTASAVEHLIMVAGGIGQTPFLALAREFLGLRFYGSPPRTSQPLSRKVTLCYGARTENLLAGVDDFRQVGVDVKLATDDGSCGRKGLVTDLLLDALQRESPQNCRVVCCGPEPMMAAAARVAKQFQIPCQVSLETPMACGIGICFTCVAKVREGDHWDYRRTCVEGPVFDADQIVW